MKNLGKLSLAVRDFIDDNIEDYALTELEEAAEEEFFNTFNEYEQDRLNPPTNT